jgi:transcriptional regulator GlxA family with amidase domain
MACNFLLDLAGPLDVFTYADKYLRECGIAGGYDVQVVSPVRDMSTVERSGIEIRCTCVAMDVEGHVDTVLIAGNDFSQRDNPLLDEFYAWLSGLEVRRVRRIGSVCGGAFALAKAGLLDGRRATTHWDICGRLEEEFPEVRVDRTAFYVQDGPIYTSGGVSSGTDLALAMVEEDHGKEVALETARKLVMFLNRPGYQVQFGHLLPVFEAPGIAERLRPWANEHLHERLDVVRMAGHLSMSPRNFTRVFHKQTGLPPAKYIEKLRVESARKFLEDTDLSLELIAERCGLGGLVSMRRTFLRHLMTTPSDYRRAFRSSRAFLKIN